MAHFFPHARTNYGGEFRDADLGSLSQASRIRHAISTDPKHADRLRYLRDKERAAVSLLDLPPEGEPITAVVRVREQGDGFKRKALIGGDGPTKTFNKMIETRERHVRSPAVEAALQAQLKSDFTVQRRRMDGVGVGDSLMPPKIQPLSRTAAQEAATVRTKLTRPPDYRHRNKPKTRARR